MKTSSNLADTLHKTNHKGNQNKGFQKQIDSHKKLIHQIKINHQNKLKHSLQQFQEQSVLNKSKHDKLARQLQIVTGQTILKTIQLPSNNDTKNAQISDTDKMLFQKKFKNFINHRQQFQAKAKQRRQKIIQRKNNLQNGNVLNEQQNQSEYIDKQELLKDTKGENQFKNAEDMIAFYEQITFGKKNKNNTVHLYHAQKIEYLFRRQEFDHLVVIQIGDSQRDRQNQLPTLVTSIKKDTLLNYLFNQPAVMMLYSINPYLLGDQLAEFQTTNNQYLTFEDFSNFLLLDRQPTYFQYSKQNLEQACKIGRGIKCQPIVSKWISDNQTYEWLIQLFKGVDILGQQKADTEVLSRKIRKQAQKKRILDEEIIQIVNINKSITLDRILYELQYSHQQSSKISLQQFERLLQHYHRLKTPEKDKLITKLILNGKYDPSYIFILGTQPIEFMKEIFNSLPKFAQYFVPKQKFVQKLVQNSKFNKIRNQLVRSEGNRYVKKQTVQQSLVRFLNQAEPYIDIQQVLDFFTNRGRPRKVQHTIYLANLQIQLARIEEQEKRKVQKKLSDGDYSTSSDEEEFQKSIKQKNIKRKKDKLALIRASQKFTEGKKFNVTVPDAFSFGDGVKNKTKVSIRQKKVKQQLEQKRRLQDQSMKPIKPKPVPQHVKQDLFQKITKEQQRQRKQRLEKFRLQSLSNMYQISPHLLQRPKSKSIYELPSSQYKFIAKPLPWYCEVNLLERIQKEKDERRERILQEIINKHNDEDLPDGFKKMIQRGQQDQIQKQRARALSKTTANDKECTFNPKITQSIPDFPMIHEHLKIDLENKKQQNKPIQIVPFSFENRPNRSRTAIEPHIKTSLNKLRQSKQSQINKQEQINIPITQKHLALINLRKKQQDEKNKKMEEQKRASTVRKMRQQKFAPYVREVLRKSQAGDIGQSRAIIESKIKEFKKQERKRKRQYQEEMIKIYTKVFNRPLLVQGQGQRKQTYQDQKQRHYSNNQHAQLNQRSNKRKQNPRQQIQHFAQDYQMPNAEAQYSKRNPQQDEYDDLRRKAIEHPPRNYLMQEPQYHGNHNGDEQDYEGEYLSENGRYTN